MELCHRHRFSLTLTCVEMCDSQHPGKAMCGPEGLLRQVRTIAAHMGVTMNGENALPIFALDGSIDTYALDRIVLNTRAWDDPCGYTGSNNMLSYSVPGASSSQNSRSNIVSAGRIGELSRAASCPFMVDYGVGRQSPGRA